ncbi:four-carbon acid sugar kinase family protein [Amylibacter sp. SFDW26]|uniref:3-oxo-tetronate kinase n=1 Tax=Amylibacter sp. SFDW26 TaxID=2652722 RepID=UPI00126161B9|nr:3-oxo-tetronate kinase [Amylibacter sp. SFDW26]KAB7615209.1 four-carbon acid sugar kinase family protein [Amylibacter sp. SFDW26]
MKIGVIADDFTGASDIALTLAQGGMRVAQFVGTPYEGVADIDAGVVALKSRTAPVDEAIAQSLEACDWLQKQGCTQIIYKVCSTFDSTDDGNIGQVLEALAPKLGETAIAVCPAFPENGRSVYQGHLFVMDQLLSDSGMKDHPLTPMRDADLRRVLSRQTTWSVSHIPATTVSAGVDAVAKSLAAEQAMFIVDAIHDADLLTIGAALKDRKLMCGGSGIALGLPANFGHSAGETPWQGVAGKGVVLSGSCSIATREQIAQYKTIAPAFELTAEDVMGGKHTAQSICDWVLAQEGAPLVYSTADPETVKAAQDTFGREAVAEKIEGFFADLAKALADNNVTRIVSAGGETSGAVVTGLSAQTLHIGPKIAAGVPALRVDNRNLVVALKSGNFGDKNFFETALNVLSGSS